MKGKELRLNAQKKVRTIQKRFAQSKKGSHNPKRTEKIFVSPNNSINSVCRLKNFVKIVDGKKKFK